MEPSTGQLADLNRLTEYKTAQCCMTFYLTELSSNENHSWRWSIARWEKASNINHAVYGRCVVHFFNFAIIGYAIAFDAGWRSTWGDCRHNWECCALATAFYTQTVFIVICVHRHSAPHIRPGHCRLPIAAIRLPWKREQGRITAKFQNLSVAKLPAIRLKIPGKISCFTDVAIFVITIAEAKCLLRRETVLKMGGVTTVPAIIHD